eukprot:15358599-Ditylum_brightwellii.AAC.1
MDEQVTHEFGIDKCTTGCVCKNKHLFKELRETPPGVGIVSIGGISKPSGIGTIVFTITESKGASHEITLENVLYIPDTPKNLISVTKWAEDRKDNYGILNRGTCSIFMWEKDELQKLIYTQYNAGFLCYRLMREMTAARYFIRNTKHVYMIKFAN